MTLRCDEYRKMLIGKSFRLGGNSTFRGFIGDVYMSQEGAMRIVLMRPCDDGDWWLPFFNNCYEYYDHGWKKIP